MPREPLIDLSALDALTADCNKLIEGVRLVRCLHAEIGPELPPEYKKALSPKTRKTWFSDDAYPPTTPLSYVEMFKGLPRYRKALEALEALWTDLGPYIKTHDTPHLTDGQGLIRSETWREVQRYFNFDDSE